MTSESSPPPQNPSTLELLNKQLAKQQAREINRGLTKLKRVSMPPTKTKKELDADKTGRFIVVPVTTVLAETIENAVESASKSVSESDIELAKSKKKKWFKWG
jgi:hypothetical protein